MITVAIFNICVVFFAYLARHKRTEFWLKGTFVLIFLFLTFRYDYGNDYRSYLEKFQEINRITTIDYFDKDFRFEPGWIFLCRLFKPLGFFAMMAVLALFNCFVYYSFVRKYVPPAYYWLAVFCYVFNAGFMLLHSSAMRQSIAIALFVFSIEYLYKKDAFRYFLCVVLASLFHTSALILLPIYLLALLNFKTNKITTAIIFLLFIFMFIFGKAFLPDINRFINVFFQRYEIYEGGMEIGTGLGLVVYSYLFLLVLYYGQSQIAENSLLFKIAIFGFLVIPIGQLIHMISRVGMYFQPATIVAFPIILFKIENKVLKNLTLLVIISITIYTYYVFFQIFLPFNTYKTIFSAPEIY